MWTGQASPSSVAIVCFRRGLLELIKLLIDDFFCFFEAQYHNVAPQVRVMTNL